MVTISCLVCPTNSAHRVDLLDNCINSIESQGIVFAQKVISVDLFRPGENKYDPSITVNDLDFYKAKYPGWTVIGGDVVSPRSMADNQIRGLAEIKSDYVFYSDDDVVIKKIPSQATLQELWNRNVGWINYAPHTCVIFDHPPPHVADYVNNVSNYLSINDDFFMRKDITIWDSYLLHFPVAIANTEIITKLHNYAIDTYDDVVGEMGIEIGLSQAWVTIGIPNEVYIYLHPAVLDVLPLVNLYDLFYFANISYYRNNSSMITPQATCGYSI